MTTREQAIAAAGQAVAPFRRERDELYAREGGGMAGALAVAQAAGHRGERAEQVARRYLGWAEEKRAERERGAA